MQCKEQVLIKFQIVQRRKYVSRLVLDFLESGLTYPHEKTTVFGFQPNARSTCTNAPFPNRVRENESSFCNVTEINILFLHQPFASAKPQARPQVLDKQSSTNYTNASNFYKPSAENQIKRPSYTKCITNGGIKEKTGYNKL